MCNLELATNYCHITFSIDFGFFFLSLAAHNFFAQRCIIFDTVYRMQCMCFIILIISWLSQLCVCVDLTHFAILVRCLMEKMSLANECNKVRPKYDCNQKLAKWEYSKETPAKKTNKQTLSTTSKSENLF